MHFYALIPAFITAVSAHGVVISVEGANGVSMPGLSIADGTPRDCSSNGCGSQADTAIIRDRELGTSEASALGRTQGNGPVDASVMIANFLGTSGSNNVPTNNGSDSGVGVEDDLSGLNRGGRNNNRKQRRQLGNLLGGLFGGGRGGGNGEKADKPNESSVAATAGEGATSDRQINQDGAGPMRADIDATSGGTDPDAFKSAEVTNDVPGVGFGGLSLATNTDFPLTVKMPQGMTCEGTVGGANNVCIVRVRNSAAAGPFGGSGAFTQSASARKRAIAFRLKKRMQIVRN
ncbi:hypothetical protein SNK03_004233 [Fusarium graminearum]|uniref:Chromosome 2, complete genome n=1 Tax=Gibberella zeae (strain ATCC MYA-4620 / CBS 123657 / FGSC 9075 / NRRL 31084 / PH-1) TaxID=229533 RepID=I1RUW3_GIBZE|nr:hypothetical protein FGSG_08021 [Fusarium graminearum PH-1]EYB25081.1 hypothetical protein FG05_08021 [Fusarium graminearum]ESU15383.1 hypothetical protein FGSG_08021 [Fusarium graminearum PH-1]KAI6753748.1 hypothetical protein HG531_005917 [Fusarium graminearum]PCD21020.1 hypothetical protein FGRA07_05172 [Fusarium graminearum]CAF3560224.1 unnamed protein product [Fusarium graminearum]|eukprot:XP_011320808.1 hypothetical protein FGSG_08021 [Fusarium graminearum PH-1]